MSDAVIRNDEEAIARLTKDYAPPPTEEEVVLTTNEVTEQTPENQPPEDQPASAGASAEAAADPVEVQAVVEEEVIAPSVTPAEPVTVVEPSMAADTPTVSASPDFDQRIEERYYQYRETNAVEYNTHGGLAGFKEASHHFVGLGMAENDAMLLTHALTTQDSNLYHTLLDQYLSLIHI